ncbi:MAG: hypothetical protein QXV32_07360 [Conexivisphaerales archaeon]
MIKDEIQTKCNFCGGRIVSTESELVCSGCGVIFGESERSVHEVYDIKSAVLPDEFRLGSYLGPRFGNSHSRGLEFGASTYSYMKMTSDHNDLGKLYRSFEYVSSMIERCCEHLTLPKRVSNMAKYMAYRMLGQFTHERGTLPALAAYCIINSCRSCRVAQSWKSVKSCMEGMGYNIRLKHMISVSLSSREKVRIEPELYLQLFIKRLLNEEMIRRRLGEMHIGSETYYRELLNQSKVIAGRLNGQATSGYSPVSVAATCVYLAEARMARAANRKKVFLQTEFCDILKISKFTLREQGVKFRKILNLS